MPMTRREICILLPALMATAGAETRKEAGSDKQPLKSAIYNFSDLTVDKSPNHDFIPVFQGSTSDGLEMTLHETALGPNTEGHAMYRHSGDEMFLVREGTLEVEMEGKRSQVGPGSVAFVSSNTEYAIRNSSQEWARYFVFLFGPPHPKIEWESKESK